MRIIHLKLQNIPEVVQGIATKVDDFRAAAALTSLRGCLKPRGRRLPRGFQDPGQEDRGVLSGKAAFAPDAPRPKGRAERFVGVFKQTLRDPCDTPGMAVFDPFLLLKARLRPQGVGRAFVTGTDLPA